MDGCEKKITVDWIPENDMGKWRNASEWKLVCDLVYMM
jgi:hypothetical protein